MQKNIDDEDSKSMLRSNEKVSSNKDSTNKILFISLQRINKIKNFC